MSLLTWINSLPDGQKLLIGLACGLLVYGIVRLFIHWVNKTSQEMGLVRGEKHYSQEQKLKNLISQSGQ